MPKESNLEFKVGLFVIAGVIAFTFFVASINETSSFGKGRTFKIIFQFANGLKANAPVRIAGVDQGIVQDIKLFFDRQDSKTKAEVEIKVSKEAQIPTDSLIMINQLGLLGEKYIEIFPGIDTKSFYQDGAVIIGKDPIAQEIISEKVMDVAKKLDAVTLENVNSLTAGLNGIVSDIRSGKGNIGRLIYDDSLYNDLHGLTSELRANPWKLLHKPK